MIHKIKWIDACSDSTWASPEEIKEWAKKRYGDELCVSVGYIVDETRKYLVVAGSFDGQGNYGERILIPKSLIVDKELIDEGNKNRTRT